MSIKKYLNKPASINGKPLTNEWLLIFIVEYFIVGFLLCFLLVLKGWV